MPCPAAGAATPNTPDCVAEPGWLAAHLTRRFLLAYAETLDEREAILTPDKDFRFHSGAAA